MPCGRAALSTGPWERPRWWGDESRRLALLAVTVVGLGAGIAMAAGASRTGADVIAGVEPSPRHGGAAATSGNAGLAAHVENPGYLTGRRMLEVVLRNDGTSPVHV